MPYIRHMNSRPAPKRAILYLRLSVSKEESTSIARQRQDLEALAEREGWTVAEILMDDGLSGGKVRANAEHALAALRSGAADVVAVYKWDRWSRMGARAVADLQDVLDERAAKRSPALFVALQDGLRSDSPAWDIQVAVLAALGRSERELIRARVRSARKYQRETRRHSGVCPYGYRTIPHPSGKGRALEIDPDEAKIVRRMADEVLDGSTGYAVAKGLNADGIKPRRAKAWTAATVADILRRDSLLGYMTHRRPGDGSRVRRPLLGPDGLPEQVWPAILTPDEAAQLRAALARNPDWNTQPGAGSKRAARLLSGLVECSTCGSPLRVNYTDRLKNGERAARYVCSASSGACPKKVSVHARMLEDLAAAEFLAVTGHMEVVEIREFRPDSSELALVEQAIASTASDLAEPGADIATLASRMAELHARRAVLEAQPSEVVREAAPTGETFAQAWEARDTAGRRHLLTSALVGRIVVAPAKRVSRTLDAERVWIPWRWNAEAGAGDAV